MDYSTIPVINLTRELVRVDSSDPGAFEGEIGAYIEQWLAKNTDAQILRDEVLPGRFNLLARLEDESSKGKPPLVFICHMDTVTLGEGWTTPPLGAELREGRVYGRGACDMKSGLACALMAFRQISLQARACPLCRPFYFIGSVDEEDFMRGAEQAILKGWVTADSLILDTEPTGGQIQVAHKGRAWFQLTVTGVTAHASTPWKGADAIAAMAEVLVSIRSQAASLPVDPDLGPTTVTFGQINGGYRPYVVPDSCTVSIDMRLAPPATIQTARSILDYAISLAKSKIPGISASYTVTGDRPSIEKDPDSFLLSQLKAACREATGEEPVVATFPGYTDTAVIAGTLHNPNCMSYGPGNLELAHKPDEWVDCRDILRCEKVLTRLARSLVFPAV